MLLSVACVAKQEGMFSLQLRQHTGFFEYLTTKTIILGLERLGFIVLGRSMGPPAYLAIHLIVRVLRADLRSPATSSSHHLYLSVEFLPHGK